MRKHLKIVNQNTAEQGARLGNLIIDRITLYAFIFITHFFLGIIYELTHLDIIYSYLSFIEGLNNLQDILFTSLFFITYYYLMERLTNGRSIGKYITGTKAISIDGKTMTNQQILYRTLSRLVPFDALSFLGNTGWHDKWSETTVVKIKTYKESLRQKEEINQIGVNN